MSLTKSKVYAWERVVTMHNKYPEADNEALAILVNCSMKTVLRGLAKMEELGLDTTSTQETISNADFKDEDAVALLMNKCIQFTKTSDNPQWARLLYQILEKKGKLDYRTREEDEWQNNFKKVNPQELVKIALNKQKQQNDTSLEKDDSETLYA